MDSNKSLLCILTVMLAGMTSVHGKDTDVYLKPPNVDREDAPNVLIILDTSGSMEDNTVSTAPQYDATINYCDSTQNPSYTGGACFSRTQVYWTTENTEPTNTSTNKYFDAANNNCADASFNLSATAGATGIYSGVHIVGWTTGNSSKGKWQDLSAGTNHKYVECRADSGIDPSGQYVNKGNSLFEADRYTASSRDEINWDGYKKPTLYAGNYLNYKKYLPASSTKTYMRVAKDAIKTLIDSNRNVRFGLMVFNRNWDGVGGTDLSQENKPPHGGRVVMKIDTMTDARRTDMKNLVENLSGKPAGVPQSTPLAETLYEAYRYFSANSVRYGDAHEETEGTAPAPVRDLTTETGETETATGSGIWLGGTYESPFRYQCQQSYVIYVTDGAPQLDTDADATIKSLANLSSSCGTSDPNYNFSDGKSCLDELAGYMYDNDILASIDGTQRVLTFTVGFGNIIKNNADALALLRDTATAGHGKYVDATDASTLAAALQSAIIDIQTTNSSFAAPSLSVNAFNKLFNRDEVYFALFKPSGTENWDGNVKKFKLCAQTTDTCTFGEVVDKNGKPAIDPVNQRIKDSAVSYWADIQDGGTVTKGGAGAQVPAPTSRVLYTYRTADGSYTGLSASSPATLHQVKIDAADALYDTLINDPTIIGLTDTSGSATTTNTADTTAVNTLLNWMLGQDSYDKDLDGSTTDSRWAHADPLHSRPAALTFGGNSANPIIKLFYSTNDGVIRMVNDYNGKEEWAFVPQEKLEDQYELAQDADGDFIEGVDGTPSFWVYDANNDGIIDPAATDFVYMYIGMRRGGNNIYAFDVTPTSKLTDRNAVGGIVPKLMWVIRGGIDAGYLKLAQTWSKPAVTKIRYACNSCATVDESQTKTVLIFGGGYNSNQDASINAGADSTGNAIYISDPLTGERIWWASDSADTSGVAPTLVLSRMNFSIPSDLALLDSDADGEADRIYVGDVGGQIWRIDLSSTLKKDSNGTKATVGYVFADIGCEGSSVSTDRPSCSSTVEHNRRKFFYPPDVAQIVDSIYEDSAESKYDLVTIASGNREDPLDLLSSAGTDPVHNRIYAFRDPKIANQSGQTVSWSPLTEAVLHDATENDLQSTANAGYATALSDIRSKKGWYIDLTESGSQPANAPSTWPWVGEKGLAKTVIFDGVLYVTTYTPANNTTAAVTCAPSEGLGKLYALNFLNGTAAVDFNSSGTLTTADRTYELGGGIPSELVTVIREGGTSGLVGTSGGAAQPPIDSALPRFKTFWYEK